MVCILYKWVSLNFKTVIKQLLQFDMQVITVKYIGILFELFNSKHNNWKHPRPPVRSYVEAKHHIRIRWETLRICRELFQTILLKAVENMKVNGINFHLLLTRHTSVEYTWQIHSSYHARGKQLWWIIRLQYALLFTVIMNTQKKHKKY